ncbi:MAG: DUF305 domain-containing protein [Caldimonas sp.]
MNSFQPSSLGRLVSTAAFVAVLGGAALAAQAQPASSPAGSSSMKPMTGGAPMPGQGSEEMHKTMMSGMEKMQQMKPTGDTDKDFAMMMKMHHQQAIEMAKPEIEHGKSAELKTMARKIVKDQTKEIGQLDAWMKKHP